MVQAQMTGGRCYPVLWAGRRAVVTLPEHIDVSNAGEIREQLLTVINRGATALIADMTATVSCDHSGAEAVVRAYQRAVVSGTQLRLVVTAQMVRRVLSLNGIDRLVSIYPSLDAAFAAGELAAVVSLVPRQGRPAADCQDPAGPRGQHDRRPEAGPSGRPATITPALLWKLVDALADGVAVTDGDGTLALVNRRLEDMFGYDHGDLIGRSVDSLLPGDLQPAHRSHRAAYARAPRARPMGAGARLVGLRKDGTTFPVEVSLSPVPTPTGHFTVAVIRTLPDPGSAGASRHPAGTATAHPCHGHDLLGRTVSSSLRATAASLQAAIDLPGEQARQPIAEAVRRLNDAIRLLRSHAVAAGRQ